MFLRQGLCREGELTSPLTGRQRTFRHANTGEAVLTRRKGAFLKKEDQVTPY